MPRLKKTSTSLSHRRRLVLFATIAEYVSTGRPVSSNALAKRKQLTLSPATIRRELHELSKDGFVIQPHTSAGRVPTDRAFRVFVDTLKKETYEVTLAREQELGERLRSMGRSGQESWQDVVRILSNFSYQAALVITPPFAESVLKQLRFIPCDPNSLLSVVVTKGGLVHNTFVERPSPLSERDLEKIHNYLGTLIEGRTLNEIRNILRKELADARARCDELRERATLLGKEAIDSSVDNTLDLVVEGRSHLAAQPELRDRMEDLMHVLEEKTRILDLLDKAAETDSGPLVIIGTEGGHDFSGCAMITAPFGSTESKGQVGVIGSTRMDYSAIIPLVNLAANMLTSRYLNDEN